MFLKAKYFPLLFSVFICTSIQAQIRIPGTFGEGIRLQMADSSFSFQFRLRFQTLYNGSYGLGSKEWTDEMIIRRARLKFDGFALSPKLVYKVELGLSSRDIQRGPLPDDNFSSSIILDAVLKWKPTRNFELWFGQTKLPGNRERVISSQDLQFVDRSLVNSAFNLDRDVGVQLRHKSNANGIVLKKIVSISMGEGRNPVIDNPGGYNYAARLEVLPFGDFTNKGDYFESDLEREPLPKLSVGLTADYNDDAVRSRGQLGGYVLDSLGDLNSSDLTTFFGDFIFKYQGWSVMGEYANRYSSNQGAAFGAGWGYVVQSAYLMKSDWEVGGRYTYTEPNTSSSTIGDLREYTAVVSRYFSGHDLKVQSDLSYTKDIADNEESLRFRFQVEMAF